MLSRTAAELYWMSRYLERAENLARMLDMSYSLSLMPEDSRSNGLEELALPLLITGSLNDYRTCHGELNASKILHFFALDGNNPGSIFNCLRHSRTNAHAVRGRITEDMWENINATWLGMLDIASQGLESYGISDFCEWVKERSHLFRGATFGTILRGDAYWFIRLGTYIERADNTLRLLDARYEMIGVDAEYVSDGSAHGYYQWSTLLRALSLYESYAESYGGSPDKAHVAELMILRQDAPRSLHTCLVEINQILACLPGKTGLPAQRLAAELGAHVRFSCIEDILSQGLHKWLADCFEHVSELSSTIQSAYLESV